MPDNGVLTLAQRGGDPSAPAVGYSSIFTTGSGIYQIDPLGTVERLGGTQQNDVLYSETLSGTGIFDVTGISQDYDHLILNIVARSTGETTGDGTRLYFNGDTTDTNYRRAAHAAGAAHTSSQGDQPDAMTIPGASSTAGLFGVAQICLLLYTSPTILQTYISTHGHRRDASNVYVYAITCNWENAEAINRITFYPDGYATDVLAAGSYLEIIGVKNL